MKKIYSLLILFTFLLFIGCGTEPTTNKKQFPIVSQSKIDTTKIQSTVTTTVTTVKTFNDCNHSWIHTEFALYFGVSQVRPCGVNVCTKCGIMILDPNYINIIEKTNNRKKW